MARSHEITHWNPEDEQAWANGGEAVAKRNLLWSVIAEHIGFSIWTVWSVMILFMPEDVYGLSAGDKFLIGATATLVGSVLRLPYTVATARFGGRNWTVFSAFVLVIPALGTLWLLANPGQSLSLYLLCAALAGFGGGNFASSMTNINAFFPQRLKGWALGLNAGGGNLGVPAIQVVGLLVIAVWGNQSPEWVLGIYLVLLVLAGVGALFAMDNLRGIHVDTRSMLHVLRHRDAWYISALYVGTFGSFIGFAFAFGQVLQLNFMADGQSAAQASLHAAQIAFIGPLLGSLSRVYGGKLADRLGGGIITLAVFGAMILATGALVVVSSIGDATGGGTGVVIGFAAGFILLFFLSGLGNGSVFKLIPTIFEELSHRQGLAEPQRAAWSQAMSGALIGIAGAVGALGGVGINLILRQSYLTSGSATAAFWAFAGFYVLAAALTYRRYVRPQPHPMAAAAPTAATEAEATSGPAAAPVPVGR